MSAVEGRAGRLLASWSRLPAGLRQPLLSVAHGASRDARVGLARADALVERGRTGAAVDALQQVLRDLQRRPAPAGLQAHQFAAHARLHALGAAQVADPLFAVAIEAGEPDAAAAQGDPAGRFAAALGYIGLRLRGSVAVDRSGVAIDREGAAADAVEITVDGAVVRRVTLGRTHGTSRFDALIRRPALAAFPTRARLAVRRVGAGGEAGARLRTGAGEHLVCHVPHGDGSLLRRSAEGPAIDKKGRLKRAAHEVRELQAAYLDEYARVAEAFEALAQRPLFLLYGTLLGRYRDGGFIPGDDDFDVGYVSREERPEAVKAEAIELMRGLMAAGFEVRVNRRGKPFRVGRPEAALGAYLDARPVWHQGGRLWAHKQACLDLPLASLAEVERVPFDGVDVAIPSGSEAFLRAYYGPGWRVPDPAFSNASARVPRAVIRNLARVCLTPAEIAELEREAAVTSAPGSFASLASHDLYPLDVFERRFGW